MSTPHCKNTPSLALTNVRLSAMSSSSQGPSRVAIALTLGCAAIGAQVVRRFQRGPVRKTPPEAEERPHAVLFGKVEGKDHGDGKLMDPPISREDPLFWLRDDDRKDEQVLAHLAEENKYTNYMTLDLKPYAKSLYSELLSHYIETDMSVPAKRGDFVYYTKTLAGKSYKYYCRKRILKNGLGEEELLLDANKLAAGHKYCDVSCTEMSPDGKLFAYTVDLSGYETYEIRFLDVSTGQLLKNDIVTGSSGSIAWGKDCKEMYYVTHDEAHRPWKVWRHTLRFDNEQGPEDVCLFTEKDTEFVLDACSSLSGRYLLLGSFASTLSEIRFLDLHDSQSGIQLFRERQPGVLYNVTHAKDDTFYVVTNVDGATNFKLMTTTACEPGQWNEFLAYDKKRKIDDAISFEKFAVVLGRENGYKEVWIMPQHDPTQMYKIEMEEAAHTVSNSTNLEYKTDKYRFRYASMITPSISYDYDVNTKEREVLPEKAVPKYNRELYRTERMEATSEDGAKIPISLVYNSKAISQHGPNPLLLYGYGSYEISMEPSFSMTRLPLLDRGVVYAIAHVRGGGEFGREWYESAKFGTKIKTFQDFCACAQHLVDEKRTTAQMMALEGRSAGGLLVGAVMNMRPDLFKAAIAAVPFVDVLNTMSDPSIPLTTGEWQEWGNPHEKKSFEAMQGYCPYSNVGAKDYPATLILAGLYDPRVMYSEPAKWAVKLRKHSTSGEPILLKVDMSSGHFSSSNRYRYLKERSFELAWLLRQLGAPDKAIAE